MPDIGVSAIRSQLRRKGYRLFRSRARISDRPNYGLFLIVGARGGFVVAGGRPWDHSLPLAEAGEWAAELPKLLG